MIDHLVLRDPNSCSPYHPDSLQALKVRHLVLQDPNSCSPHSSWGEFKTCLCVSHLARSKQLFAVYALSYHPDSVFALSPWGEFETCHVCISSCEIQTAARLIILTQFRLSKYAISSKSSCKIQTAVRLILLGVNSKLVMCVSHLARSKQLFALSP